MSDVINDPASSEENINPSAGYIYGCCAGEQYDATKCGFTTTPNPFAYCRKNYGRTMIPLNIVAVYSVPMASLAEDMLFCALAEYRVDKNHEVFNISPEILKQGMECVKASFEVMRSMNNRLAPAVQVEIRRDLSAERRVSIGPSVSQIKRQEAAQRREARIKQHEEDMKVKLSENEQLKKDVASFIADKCDTTKGSKTPGQQVFEAFRDLTKSKTGVTKFYREMERFGFKKKMIWTKDYSFQGFHNLKVKT